MSGDAGFKFDPCTMEKIQMAPLAPKIHEVGSSYAHTSIWILSGTVTNLVSKPSEDRKRPKVVSNQ